MALTVVACVGAVFGMVTFLVGYRLGRRDGHRDGYVLGVKKMADTATTILHQTFGPPKGDA